MFCQLPGNKSGAVHEKAVLNGQQKQQNVPVGRIITKGLCTVYFFFNKVYKKMGFDIYIGNENWFFPHIEERKLTLQMYRK